MAAVPAGTIGPLGPVGPDGLIEPTTTTPIPAGTIAPEGPTAPAVVSTSITSIPNAYYLLGAVVGSILLSNTRVAPLVAGILSVALIFQLNLLLTHK